MAKVRIGIVSWNTAELLGRCLDSLPAATSGLDAEVVVVDNDSADDSVSVAEQRPGVRVIRNAENVGYAKAMNQALLDGGSLGDRDVLIALNPDTESPPGSLAALTERLLADPAAGLVAPRLVFPDGTLQHSVYRFPSPAVTASLGLVPRRVLMRGLGARMWLEGYAPHDKAGFVDWAIGAVHVIRTEALAGELPYDERWFMYVEDLDLCWRLHERGWRCRFEPDVEVIHIGNAAGSQAWGAARSNRWWRATYDWYRLRHGNRSNRAWAAINLTAVTLKLARPTVKRLVGRDLQPWEQDLFNVFPTHAREVGRRSE